MWRVLAEGSPGLNDFASFGAAGIMGAMWLWERTTSRRREEQLDEAHTRIIADKVQLDELISVVRQNTEVMTRLTAAQEQLGQKLSGKG